MPKERRLMDEHATKNGKNEIDPRDQIAVTVEIGVTEIEIVNERKRKSVIGIESVTGIVTEIEIEIENAIGIVETVIFHLVA